MLADGFDAVFCPKCKRKVSSPFRASGFPRGHGGAWWGECAHCGAIFLFDLSTKHLKEKDNAEG